MGEQAIPILTILGIQMHPKHELLLKKNARLITDENHRAFYYAEDQGDGSSILHIDRKIIKSAKFSGIKKVNKTLEPFKDPSYILGDQARMCAGMVSRDDQGLLFSVEIKKGLGAGQLSRSLKQFKKLIGSARVQKGDDVVDGSEVLASPDVYWGKLQEYLEQYGVTHALTSQTQDHLNTLSKKDKSRPTVQSSLEGLHKSEEEIVEKCLRTMEKYLEATEAAGQDVVVAQQKVVVGKSVAQWQAELSARELVLSALIDPDSGDDLTAAIQEELEEANLAERLQGTREQMLDGVSNFLLHQQQMFRQKNTQIDGKLSPDELFFTGKDGAKLVLSDKLLKKMGLNEAFSLVDGVLQLKDPFLTDKGISKRNRGRLAELLVAAAESGYDLHLRNPMAGGRASLDLHQEGDRLEESVTRRAPASPTNLHFDRSSDIVPGSEPPRRFADIIGAMNACKSDDIEGFRKLNQTLSDAFALEKASGAVADSMTFQQYKMQFIQLNVPDLDKRGLRWHDGSDQINAAEWVFLQQKVKDLPNQAQYYFWLGFKEKGKVDAEQDWEQMPLPTDFRKFKGKKRAAEFQKFVKKYYNVKKWEIELGQFSYYLPGREDLLPKIKAIPPLTLRTLLADEEGAVQSPDDGSPLDPTDETALKGALEGTIKAMHKTVMTMAMTSWAENSGESVASLLKPIPDTQKVFLRQSNGTANFDEVFGEKIGQETVTQPSVTKGNISGNNDNGAFGKCAPTSYFCGSICGISTGARDGLDVLKSDPETRAAATTIEVLLTAVPTNADSRDELDKQIKALEDKLQKAWKATTSADGVERARLQRLWEGVVRAKQMKTSIVDRLVVQTDDEGPFMEMEFLIPKSSTDPYMKDQIPPLVPNDTKVKVKVRPENIQEYLEQTNRSDNYRGGKKHMMDFFKDPSSMNQIQLMKSLGPGLIAVGIDQALKAVGKESGLLYGPGGRMVSTMVYNKLQNKGDFQNTKDPIPHKKGTTEYDQEFKDRRRSLLSMLESGQKRGGGLAVSMGYNMNNGHVNYVQAWGTPKIDGVEISAEDLARCHMNHVENSGTSSAWQGDRNSDTLINTEKMIQGLTAIQDKLSRGGKGPMARKVQEMIQQAREAQAGMDRAARAQTPPYASAAEWVQKAQSDWTASNALMTFKLSQDNAVLNLVRKASADVMAWLKDSMVLDHNEGGINPDNVVIMPSNTERDNSVTDTEADRSQVGGGQIGSQQYGSANAADASYFVPLNALASGWNGTEDKATGYTHYQDDPTDRFIMLSDIELMA